MNRCISLLLASSVSLFAFAPIMAAEAVTLDTAKDPGANKADEPLAKEFSLGKAVSFLDSAALVWQKDRQCFTCHTNYAHLYARPSIAGDAPAAKEVRKFAEE